MRILGIDPGSRVAGYGVIDVDGSRIDYVTCGVIRVRTKASFPDRLMEIYDGITQVIDNYKPEQAAIEQVFMSRNPSSALKLGHARGVLMLAAMQRHISMAEYSARQVKQGVAGYGNADKEQVQHMVQVILSLLKCPSEDAADALAVAICHANHGQCGF